MKRRDFLLTAGAALGVSAFPGRWAAAAENGQRKVLYFTRSAGYEHSVVRRKGSELSHSERILTELGQQHDVEVVCTKDGRVFDGDLDQYDVIAFYTTGDLCNPKSSDKAPPMSPQGKQRLLDVIAGGKGFVGFHSATDSFHSKGKSNANQKKGDIDPYIAMLGGEFIKHGPQQEATMRVADRDFPGLRQLGSSFVLKDEWYTLKNFAPDLHVILVQETKGMQGACYQRPPFPATWARAHAKGRVFYTSMGHREDVWTNSVFQQVLLGSFWWAAGNGNPDLTPNRDQVAPHSDQLSASL
jgi:uncharacterized protein